MEQTKRDRKEKLNYLTLHSEKCKLIYEWVKTGKISLQEYLELIEELEQKKTMKTAVEWLVEQIIKEKGLVDLDIQAAKEMEKEQKIDMLHSIIHDAQMGEDVEDVEAWFEDYEKKQEQVKKELTSEEIPKSFFKPVLGEPIWNIRTKQFKQQ